MAITMHLMVLDLPLVLHLSTLSGIGYSTLCVWGVRIATTVPKFQEHVPPVMCIFGRCMMWCCWQKARIVVDGCGCCVNVPYRCDSNRRICRIGIGVGIQRVRGRIE